MEFGSCFDLKSQIRRGSSEKPSGAIGAQRQLSLRASLAAELILAHGQAVSAATIPLREPTPSRGTEDANLHLGGLEFCAYVGVDLAAEKDFFKYRTGPSH
jgi:hypothetical protein